MNIGRWNLNFAMLFFTFLAVVLRPDGARRVSHLRQSGTCENQFFHHDFWTGAAVALADDLCSQPAPSNKNITRRLFLKTPTDSRRSSAS